MAAFSWPSVPMRQASGRTHQGVAGADSSLRLHEGVEKSSDSHVLLHLARGHVRRELQILAYEAPVQGLAQRLVRRLLVGLAADQVKLGDIHADEAPDLVREGCPGHTQPLSLAVVVQSCDPRTAEDLRAAEHFGPTLFAVGCVVAAFHARQLGCHVLGPEHAAKTRSAQAKRLAQLATLSSIGFVTSFTSCL